MACDRAIVVSGVRRGAAGAMASWAGLSVPSTSVDDMSETIDPRDNPESQVAEEDATQLGTRSSLGGTPPTPAPEAGQDPIEMDLDQGTPAGTGQDDPLAGVRISEDDREQAVSGDTGPEHPGERRASGAGHA